MRRPKKRFQKNIRYHRPVRVSDPHAPPFLTSITLESRILRVFVISVATQLVGATIRAADPTRKGARRHLLVTSPHAPAESSMSSSR